MSRAGTVLKAILTTFDPTIRLLTDVLLICFLLAAPHGARAATPLFVVRTGLEGLDYVNVSGSDAQEPILEQNGQGVALLDYDGDGRLDIFVANGGTLARWRAGSHPGSRLYRNLSKWRFEDVTSRAGVKIEAWSNGAAVADYDDDGDMDVYVTNWGPNTLYRNDGDGHFSDVTLAAGVGESRWSSSAVFADFDGDGRLDLYVSNYVAFDPDEIPRTEKNGSACRYRGLVTGCGPWRYRGEQDTLYIQQSDGGFRDASAEWKLDATAGYRGMGIAPGDFDADGDVDLYVGCDVMPNLYLENVDHQHFSSVGRLRGGAVNAMGEHESGMGVAAADLFNRGRIDILTTNFADQKNTYYRNLGGRWQDASLEVGLGRHRSELGWGIIAKDFDQDGWRDVFIANGQIYPQVDQLGDPHDRYAQSPRLYLGTNGRTLKEVPPAEAFAVSTEVALRQTEKQTGEVVVAFNLRAAAAGDLDGDGDLDVVAVQHRGPLVIFENRSNQPVRTIVLQTRSGGLSPHGAHISAHTSGRAWHHFHWPNQGYQSSHDPRVFIPRANSGNATIEWPDGMKEQRPLPPLGERVIWRESAPGRQSPRPGESTARGRGLTGRDRTNALTRVLQRAVIRANAADR